MRLPGAANVKNGEYGRQLEAIVAVLDLQGFEVSHRVTTVAVGLYGSCAKPCESGAGGTGLLFRPVGAAGISQLYPAL